jgi:hypothetical protein
LVSAYVTVKVKDVAVVPLGGEARPLLRRGLCAWLEHGPAPQVAVVTTRFATIARESARRRRIAIALLVRIQLTGLPTYAPWREGYMNQKYA